MWKSWEQPLFLAVMGMLWRERVGEGRGQKHHMWYVLSYFFLPLSLRTFSYVVKFVFPFGVYCCRSLLCGYPRNRGRVGASVRIANSLPQPGQAPELLFKSHVVSWVQCRTAPGTPLFVFLNMCFCSEWILCQWRNYTSYFKIPLLVKWMLHLYSEQLPLS